MPVQHPAAPGGIEFISTVTGGILPSERLDASYWWKNVRCPFS